MRIGRTRSVSGIGAFFTVCGMGTLLAVTLLAAGPAQADSIKFFSGTTGYTGIFSGAGVYDAIKNLSTACVGGGTGCSGNPDVISTPQTYDGGITASALVGGGVWNDLSPNFAGLGVGPLDGIPSSADQIEGTDKLNIHFNTSVTLTGIATLFVDPHKPFGTGFPEETDVTNANTFLLNGVSTTFLLVNTGFSLFGQDFTFQQQAGQPSFYVGGLTWTTQCTNCENPPGTPIPGAVWLFGTVIAGGAGYGRWRKKRKAATNAA